MLSRLLRELLFVLLHCVLALCEFASSLREHVLALFDPRKPRGSDAEYIARNVGALKRRPRHIVIMTERQWLDIEELANLALWSLLAGVPFVSFYDPDDMLKFREADLFSEIEKRKRGVPGCIKWSDRPDLNGYSNGHKPFTSTINIFTQLHGKRTIVRFVHDLIEKKVTCPQKSEESFTPEDIDPVLKTYYPDVPDPEIIMFCGPLCMSKGLLPWQIRLSEFIPLDKYKKVRVEDFVKVLRKYSKCDQRFGT